MDVNWENTTDLMGLLLPAPSLLQTVPFASDFSAV